jgi:hypothetical protein
LTDSQKSIDSAENEIQSLQRIFTKLKVSRVKGTESKQIAKATALSWFNAHRPVLISALDKDDLTPLDDLYRKLLDVVTRDTVRTKYIELTKTIKKNLAAIQTKHAVTLAKTNQPTQTSSSDRPPSFAPLVSDPKMQQILARRWIECTVCVTSNAPLAAIVMMGGLLEGLLLAKINQTGDKTKIIGARARRKTGQHRRRSN